MSLLPYVLGLLGALGLGIKVWWLSKTRRDAVAHAVAEGKRADVAEATGKANVAAVEREAASVIVAADAIPTVTATGSPPTVEATDAAWAASDAQRRSADRVRGKIVKGRRNP